MDDEDYSGEERTETEAELGEMAEEEAEQRGRKDCKKKMAERIEKFWPCENEIPCSVRQAEADLHNEKIEPCPNCRKRKGYMICEKCMKRLCESDYPYPDCFESKKVK